MSSNGARRVRRWRGVFAKRPSTRYNNDGVGRTPCAPALSPPDPDERSLGVKSIRARSTYLASGGVLYGEAARVRRGRSAALSHSGPGGRTARPDPFRRYDPRPPHLRAGHGDGRPPDRVADLLRLLWHGRRDAHPDPPEVRLGAAHRPGLELQLHPSRHDHRRRLQGHGAGGHHAVHRRRADRRRPHPLLHRLQRPHRADTADHHAGGHRPRHHGHRILPRPDGHPAQRGELLAGVAPRRHPDLSLQPREQESLHEHIRRPLIHRPHLPALPRPLHGRDLPRGASGPHRPGEGRRGPLVPNQHPHALGPSEVQLPRLRRLARRLLRRHDRVHRGLPLLLLRLRPRGPRHGHHQQGNRRRGAHLRPLGHLRFRRHHVLHGEHRAHRPDGRGLPVGRPDGGRAPDPHELRDQDRGPGGHHAVPHHRGRLHPSSAPSALWAFKSS